MFDLSGKVALVTGANSGIGLAFATGIARAGADVVIWGRRADRNEAAAAELREHGGRVLAQQVDVADEAQVVAGVADALVELNRLDCVIANAGVTNNPRTFLDMTTAQYQELIDVHQLGAYFTLREGLRHMVERAEAGDPGGSLIACGSVSGRTGSPTKEHYSAVKAAVEGLMKGIAVEYGRYGVRANVIVPGIVDTQFDRTLTEENRQTKLRLLREVTPVGREGRPSDFEGIAVYLMSDASAFHTGDLITVDGGLTAQLPLSRDRFATS